ncbi:MAG: bifunctional diaminohydroxyphosphoribosylaminopyrimidine deaminase/5-amino-6-(5-phosphoribosylamino)uracil reductase RibD [Pseudomonadota bacterium]|nr:bifunctional diaminohydroxyphosphoribosylaminopyrimidine deaminase/5-amino-6-(5-phosphoribosylamino)uracil reductase RibD [Pseudomonadota bacterium]
MTDQTTQDQRWMQRALALARRGQYTTRPNPVVGCVIVKDGQLIGEGFHPKAGQPHAEVFALAQAAEQAHGATAYVTLEPCAHFGRTPPCANALVAAGVVRVVMASLDPNPLVAGKGQQILAAAGIATTVGVCEAEARALNAGFLQVMAGGRPYVRLKVAASLDGRTAMASGESKWITGAPARADVQHWRAISGAVITGIGTVLADDPLLNVRALSDGTDMTDVPQPLRVVLDRQGRMPTDAQLSQDPASLLLVGAASVVEVETWDNTDLASVLCRLRDEKQIRDVLVEAGATLSAAFLQAGLVDELIVYLAPTVLGSAARPMFDLPLVQMAQQLRFELIEMQPVGQDIRLRLQPIR